MAVETQELFSGFRFLHRCKKNNPEKKTDLLWGFFFRTRWHYLQGDAQVSHWLCMRSVNINFIYTRLQTRWWPQWRAASSA